MKVNTSELKDVEKDSFMTEEEMVFDVSVVLDSVETSDAVDSVAASRINKHLITHILNQPSNFTLSEAVNAFIEQKKEDFRNEEYSVTHYDHITGIVQGGLDGIINYTVNEDFYGGGAHPTQVVTIKRYDMQTGNPLEVWDVFEDSCSNSIKSVLTKKLMQQEGVKTIEELREIGFLEMVDMFIPQNFWLDADSISFFFNQYDIAPYALGQICLTFSYAEMKSYLKAWVWEKAKLE